MELRARLWFGAGLGAGLALWARPRSRPHPGAALAGAAVGALLAGLLAPRREIRRRLYLAAPLEHVFETLTDPARLAHFMAHVRRVEALDEEHWRWVVQPPRRAAVEWVAVITRHEPNALVAWETVAGTPLWHRGMLRFRPARGGGTLLEVHWRGRDAAVLDCLADDLAAARGYLETGRLSPRSGRCTPDDRPNRGGMRQWGE